MRVLVLWDCKDICNPFDFKDANNRLVLFGVYFLADLVR